MKSGRHHYLPEFYIKGFVNSKKKVHVFDKFENKFKKKEFSPRQIFFKWDRNSLFLDGEKDDFIERLYGSFESKLSPTYNKIKRQNGKIQYGINDVFNLLLLVTLTHWRLPVNDDVAEKFVSSRSNKELFIKVFDKETGEEASENLYNNVKRRSGFIEMYKLVKPYFDYMSLDIKTNFNNWKIYSAASEVQLHLLGDNPIVLKKQFQDNILQNELIFPLTKGITLYHNKGKKIKQIEPESRIKVDVMVFLQSKRYIVGPNGDYLNTIQQLANGYNTKSKIEVLRNEIFEIFE